MTRIRVAAGLLCDEVLATLDSGDNVLDHFSSLMRLAALGAALIAGAPSAVRGEPPAERLDIDPVVRGIWTVHATSKDEGETIERVQPPIVLCRVTATKVRMANGTEMRVARVLVMKDDEGYPMNLVRFEDETFWGISKHPGQPFVLVQVFTGAKLREKVRFLVTVEE